MHGESCTQSNSIRALMEDNKCTLATQNSQLYSSSNQTKHWQSEWHLIKMSTYTTMCNTNNRWQASDMLDQKQHKIAFQLKADQPQTCVFSYTHTRFLLLWPWLDLMTLRYKLEQHILQMYQTKNVSRSRFSKIRAWTWHTHTHRQTGATECINSCICRWW